MFFFLKKTYKRDLTIDIYISHFFKNKKCSIVCDTQILLVSSIF